MTVASTHRGLDVTEFLLKDYELKIQCLGEHLQRMWMRFNFFVTLQSGLAAALAIVGADGGNQSATPYLLGAETALGLIWWVFGAQDRFLVVEYRASIDETATSISVRTTEPLPVGYRFASVVEGDSACRDLFEWRLAHISITRLPAVVPLFMTGVWLVILLAYLFTT